MKKSTCTVYMGDEGIKNSDFLFDDVFYGWPSSKSKSLERQPSWP